MDEEKLPPVGPMARIVRDLGPEDPAEVAARAEIRQRRRQTLRNMTPEQRAEMAREFASEILGQPLPNIPD